MENSDKLKVLLLTANSEHVKAALQSLGSLGFKLVSTMDNGLVALEKIKTDSFDFVMCDQDMRFISGWLFIKEIKAAEQIPNIPVLLFGKAAPPEEEDKLKKYGVVKYLQAPFTPSNLSFLINSTITLTKTSGTIENKFSKAKDSLIKNNVGEAIELFSELRGLTKDSTRSLIGLAQSHELNSDHDKAYEMLELAAKNDDQSPSRILVQARVYLKKSRTDDALAIIRQLLNEVPNEFYYSRVANLFMDYNLYKPTGAICREALKKKFEIPDFYVCLAKCEYSNGLMTSAMDIVDQAGQKFGMNPDLFNLKGVILKKEGKYQDALFSYEEALRLSPTDAKIHFNMAMCSIGMKDYTAAIRQLEVCIKIAPNFPKAAEKLAELKGRQAA